MSVSRQATDSMSDLFIEKAEPRAQTARRGGWVTNVWLSLRLHGNILWWIGATMFLILLVLADVLGGFLSKLWLRFPGLDKPTHFLAYLSAFLFIYGVMRGRAWPSTRATKLGAALVLCLALSVVDELQQAFVGRGRTAEYGDLVADASGALVGLTMMITRELGRVKAMAIGLILLVPVTAVTMDTYRTLKHFNRGMVYEREHEYKKARAEYMLALSGGFHSPELYNTIAWLDIEFLDADPLEAGRYAAKAFEMEPSNADILDTYGWILIQQGRVREGLPFLERARQLKPEMYCIDLHLGVAYREVGDYQKAMQYLQNQIQHNASDRFGQTARKVLRDMESSMGQ